jgi:hypothetical protein
MWFLAEVGESILDEQCMCPVPTEDEIISSLSEQEMVV